MTLSILVGPYKLIHADSPNMSLRKHIMATSALGAAGVILAVDPFSGGPTLLFAAAFGFVGVHMGALS